MIEAERRIEAALRGRARSLDLHGLQLQTLPETLWRLIHLEELHLSWNGLTVLPDAIASLANLKGLYLSMNEFDSVCSSLGALSQLQVLDLSHNQLDRLPKELGALVSLRVLNLSDNALAELPDFLAALHSLQEVNLSNNRLRSLPAAAGHLAGLKRLFLHGNPHLGLTPEALGPSYENVWRDHAVPRSPRRILERYFHVRDTRPLNEAKMLLVGRGGVGKTSLARRMVQGDFSASQETTHGIAITPWGLALGNETLRINIWDFGGQEIMHATHQFFLTKRSLYLLVINAREGEQDRNIEYWLRLIQSFGGDSPVIVVINKIKDHYFELNQRGLRAKFPSVRAFVETDCEASMGIERLKGLVAAEITKLSHVRDPFPSSWFSIKDRLSDLREDYISYPEYRALCVARGVDDEAEQERLLSFLNDLGIVVSFREHPCLRDTHVLNPRWVTDGIYKVLNHPPFAVRKTGELGLAELANVLKPPRYPFEKHQYILELMKQFELCYELYEEPEHYLVPELLTKEEPELSQFSVRSTLTFRYRYDVLPEGVLPRFIVRARALNQGLPRWRHGVVLKFEGTEALIRAEAEERRVTITILGRSAGARRLLTVVRSDFERIHSSIAKLEVSEEVLFMGTAIACDELRAMDRAGRATFPKLVDGNVVSIKVKDLIERIEEPASFAASRAHPEVEIACGPVHVVLSYSRRDSRLRDELETHLKILERRGLVQVWSDRAIVGGEDWAESIDDNFERADVVLLLISRNFFNSDYCYEREMKIALDRHTRGEAVVIPIIVRPCQWKATPIEFLQALPEGTRPVTSWRNRDEAWKDVAAGIEKAVRKRWACAPKEALKNRSELPRVQGAAQRTTRDITQIGEE